MAGGEYVLYVTTHGLDAPMKAALAFAAANAMHQYGVSPKDADARGVTAKVALLDDAVLLLAPGVSASLEVPGRGKLDLLMNVAMKNGTEIWC